MRKDISKVIVERSRLGGRDRPGRKPRGMDLPKKEGMRRSHSDKKTLNENLKPLRRFLEKNVGNLWDNVFSEICENIKLTSTVQKHVRDHIKDFVMTSIKIKGDKVYGQRRSYMGKFTELYSGDLYVDSKGILRLYTRKIIKREKINPLVVALNQFSSGKGRFAIDGTSIYKVYQNPTSHEWDVFNLANATHARMDFQNLRPMQIRELHSFLYKNQHLLKWKSEYVDTLVSLFLEWYKEDERKRLAKQSLKNARYKPYELVEVLENDSWILGMIAKVRTIDKKKMELGYDILLENGNMLKVNLSEEDEKLRPVRVEDSLSA